jgi:Ca2+-binding RTX toxin-like protein
MSIHNKFRSITEYNNNKAIAGFLTSALGAVVISCAIASPAIAGTKVINGKTWISYDENDTTVVGTDGRDRFIGGWGRSNTVTVRGEGGNDLFLAGEQMEEIFHGGPGADRWVFRAETSDQFQTDTIMDFNVAEGDKIDLRFIDANTKLPGHQSFRFIGSQPFQGTSGTYAAAGQLRVADGVLEGDTNGAFGEPELIVKLNNVSSLPRSALLLSSPPKLKKNCPLGRKAMGLRIKNACK